MIEIIPNWHPLFVHFTVALFSLSIIFFILQYPFAETGLGDDLLVFARYSLWLGVLFSLLTLAAGWDAYNTVDHDTPSHAAMTDHRNWGFGTFAVFVIAAIWWAIVKAYSEKASIVFILFLVVGGGLLVTTGHKGSQLVYFFGLGVQNLPEKDDHKSGGAHSHSHDEGAEKGHDDKDDHAHDENEKGHDDQHPHDSEKADENMEGMSMDSQSMPKLDNTEDDVMVTPIKTTEPKIEKYEDGTVRETLPEIAMDIQE